MIFEIFYIIIGFLMGNLVTVVYRDITERQYQQDYKVKCAKLETQIKCMKGDLE